MNTDQNGSYYIFAYAVNPFICKQPQHSSDSFFGLSLPSLIKCIDIKKNFRSVWFPRLEKHSGWEVLIFTSLKQIKINSFYRSSVKQVFEGRGGRMRCLILSFSAEHLSAVYKLG